MLSSLIVTISGYLFNVSSVFLPISLTFLLIVRDFHARVVLLAEYIAPSAIVSTLSGMTMLSVVFLFVVVQYIFRYVVVQYIAVGKNESFKVQCTVK